MCPVNIKEKQMTDVESKSEEIRLLQKINRLLYISAPIEQIYEAITRGLTGVFHYHVSAIYISTEDGTRLTCEGYNADSDITKKIEKLTGITPLKYSLPLLDGSVMNQIIKTKKPLITTDLAQVVKSHTEDPKIRAMAGTLAKISKAKWGMGVPLLADEKVVGVIGVGSREELKDEDVLRLSSLGDQIGLALERRRKTEETRRSHERLISVLDSLEAVVYVADMKTHELLFINKHVRELFGNVVGKKCWQSLQSGQQGPCDFCSNEHLMTSGGEPTGVYKWEFQNTLTGQWFDIRDRAIEWIDGRVVRLEIATDISERKRAEEKLRSYSEKLESNVREQTKELVKQKELLETITEGIEEGILLLSKDLSIQWANQKIKERSGYEDKEIIGRRCYEVTHSQGQKCEEPNDICPIDEVLRTGKQKSEVHIHYDREGKGSYVEVTAYPIKENGEITRFVHLSRDITEKMKLDREMKKLKEFNENIVQSIEEGILLENDEGYITFANPRMLNMLNASGDDLIGMNWSELFSADSHKTVMEENQRIKDGNRTRFEAALNLKGKNLPVIVSATPLMEGESYVGNIKVFVDITDRKEAEERLRQKVLKYNIERGRSYLVMEPSLSRGLDALRDLLDAGFEGLAISRAPSSLEGLEESSDVKIIWLSEKMKGKGVIPPDLNIIRKMIEDFASGKSVILLDRLDYLIVQNGFNHVLRFLQEINETIHMAKAVLLVVVDEDILSNNEKPLLEKEFMGIESKYQVHLEKDLLDILLFVKTENEKGMPPVHKDVAAAFKITRPTAIKRLNRLKSRGLIRDAKHGRFKRIELTDKAKEII